MKAKSLNDSAFYVLSRLAQANEGLFWFTSSKIAPHLAETISPTGSVCFAKLSKRELDFILFFLLPCGAKPSALVL